MLVAMTVFLFNTSNDRFPCNSVKQVIQMFDGGYSPDLSNCVRELEPATSQFGQYWPITTGFAQIPLNQGLQLPQHAGLLSDAIDPELLEFERLKVERQILASLYAMNGVNEYLENALDPNDALWDLPTLCQLFCPN